MEVRPTIQVKPTATDILLEIAAAVILISVWAMVLFVYSKVPDNIPIHFSGSDDPDGYGSKRTVFALPAIGTLLYFLLTVAARYPQFFNYPVAITEQNAEKQYRIAVQLMRYMKFAVLLIFTVIEYNSYKVAIGVQEGLGRYFIIFIFAVLFLPMFFFLVSAFRNR